MRAPQAFYFPPRGISRSMSRTRSIVALLAAIAIPLIASAQTTLPPSTQDRQHIADLQYQLTQPGTSAADRARIEREISQLQYQINTRPAIQPAPAITPNWSGSLTLGNLPRLDPNATPVPLGPAVYGSCEADRAVIEYLKQELQDPTTSHQERTYDRAKLNELETDLKSRNC